MPRLDPVAENNAGFFESHLRFYPEAEHDSGALANPDKQRLADKRVSGGTGAFTM